MTNSAGTFSVPALDAGTYTVTVSLSGFKTALVKDVVLAIGTPGSIKAVLEVGGIEQTVEVVATTQLINTQTPTIASTLTSEQINKLPVATRNLVNAVTFLPGVNTAGVNRDSNFNGLPDSFVAISLDGVNNNENFNKSTEGLFAMVTPRPDAVEAVTVTTAGAGADVGGHGAVQIAFQTRSGTNRFTGSAYHYHRSPGTQHELLLQRDQRSAEERRRAESVRLPPGRTDRHPEAVRRARQGVLLLQLRGAAAAERLHADAHGDPAAGAGRRLFVGRDGKWPDGHPDA